MKMTKTTLALATIIASISINPSLAEEVTDSSWLHCGNLIDTQAGDVLGERFIKVTGNTISEVTTNKPASASLMTV